MDASQDETTRPSHGAGPTLPGDPLAGQPKAVDDHHPPARLRLSWQAGSLRRNFGLIASLLLLVGLVGAAFLAPLPFDPLEPDGFNTIQPPDGLHWFGTDPSGFDVFSRTIVAARLDVPLALAGTLAALLIGVPLGLIAGGRGRLGEFLMRGLDAVQAFPLLILALVVVSAGGNRVLSIIGAITLVVVPRFMRIIRAESLHLREARFVEAARAFGASPTRVLFRHLLPNVWPVLLVQAALASGLAIRVIAALSFLGIGIAPPEASWGAMVRVGSQYIATGQWWIALFPGIAVFLVVAAFNIVADRVEAVASRSQR